VFHEFMMCTIFEHKDLNLRHGLSLGGKTCEHQTDRFLGKICNTKDSDQLWLGGLWQCTFRFSFW